VEQSIVLPIVASQIVSKSPWQRSDLLSTDPLEGLKLAKFRIDLRIETAMSLPPFMGAEFRNGFRAVFKNIACPDHQALCVHRRLSNSCIYQDIFGISIASGSAVAHEHEHAPHPFVFTPPLDGRTHFPARDQISLELVLVGRAIQRLRLFTDTLAALGMCGVGTQGARYVIERVEPWDGFKHSSLGTHEEFDANAGAPTVPLPHILDGSDFCKEERDHRVVALSFVTPTRIVLHGQLASRISFSTLLAPLLRRIALLRHCYCGQEADPSSIRKLILSASSVRSVASNLRWQDWTRFGAGRQTLTQLGGIVGSVVFQGTLGPFLPVLRAGEWIHVGKVASFGLGRYSLQEQ
jgi:hypothetical protein